MNTIDELGAVKAQIAELKELEKELAAKVKGEIFDSGEASLEGDLFRATLTMTERSVTNWKKIAKDLGASPRRIQANTEKVPVNSLRLTARTANSKAA